MFLVRYRAALRRTRLCLPSVEPSFVKHALLFTSVSVSAAISYSLVSGHADVLPLDPSRFTPATLIESVDVSSNTKLLTLSISPQLLPRDTTAFAPIWSIFVKDSDIQVERPYTPLEGIDQNGYMRLWVKKYELGEVGRWLHSRQVGDAIEIRGPVKTGSTLWQNGHWDEVVLISGGTGITPFYQLLYDVFKAHDTSSNVRFTLLHGSRSLADIPPPSMMQSLLSFSQEHPDKFRLHLFIESINDTSDNHSLTIRRGRISKSVVQDALRLTPRTSWWRRFVGLSGPTLFEPERRVLVLVCGPEGMVNAMAGPYGPNYSQGGVGGILGELGLRSHQVWKL